MAYRRNGPATHGLWRFWGRKGQRFTLIPHFCTAAGWELWFTTPRQAEATKIHKASQSFLLPQQILVYACPGSPLQVVVAQTKHHQTHRLFLHPTFNYTNYTDYWWEGGQPKTCYNACDVCPILNSHHWAQALACDSVPALCSLYNSRVRNPRFMHMPSWEWEDWCAYGCMREGERLSTSCCLDRHIQHWTFDSEIPLADLSNSTR